MAKVLADDLTGPGETGGIGKSRAVIYNYGLIAKDSGHRSQRLSDMAPS